MAGGTFLAVHLISRGGIGFGDVKLAAVIGMALGMWSVTSALLALMVGSIAAVVWMKATKRAGQFAYGPWLLMGGWVAAVTAAVPHWTG